MDNNDEDSFNIQFKKRNKKSLRKRTFSDDDDSDSDKVSLRYNLYIYAYSVLNKY